MNEPDDLDELLSKAIASYIPEPGPGLNVCVMRRVRQPLHKLWALVPAALAAGIAVAVLLRQPAVKSEVKMHTQPIQVTALAPRDPRPSAVRSLKHFRRRSRLPLTREEMLFLAVADKMPNQFPQLVAIPETKAIEPITIADLQPPQTTGDSQ